MVSPQLSTREDANGVLQTIEDYLHVNPGMVAFVKELKKNNQDIDLRITQNKGQFQIEARIIPVVTAQKLTGGFTGADHGPQPIHLEEMKEILTFINTQPKYQGFTYIRHSTDGKNYTVVSNQQTSQGVPQKVRITQAELEKWRTERQTVNAFLNQDNQLSAKIRAEMGIRSELPINQLPINFRLASNNKGYTLEIMYPDKPMQKIRVSPETFNGWHLRITDYQKSHSRSPGHELFDPDGTPPQA